MTNSINTQNRFQSTPATLDHKGQSSKPSAESSSQPSSSSVVDLQSTKILASMSAELSNVPDMDSAKVDAIKQAIANGDYQPNAEVIAEKFIEIERLL